MHAVLVGFGLGFVVAVQLGPMSLFLIRSTLRRGWAVGLAIGAGIAVIDGVYATLGAAGAVPLLTIGPLRVVLGLVGAAVLVVLGVRTLWSAFRVRSGGELDVEVSGPRRAFLTSLAGTASNPATIASWAAIFAAASAGTGRSAGAAALLVTGVALGSASLGDDACDRRRDRAPCRRLARDQGRRLDRRPRPARLRRRARVPRRARR